MYLKKKYIGITLIFVYPETNCYEAAQRSYVIQAKGLNEIYEKANNLGLKQESKLREDKCKYIGLYDIFEINGQLRHGCVVGRSTYWSYKNTNLAKKLIKKEKDFGIHNHKFSSLDKFYLAKIVYFLDSLANYKFRRTIIFNVLVKSLRKSQVIKCAQYLAQSPALIKGLKNILSQYESRISGDIKFLGFTDIQYIPEKVKLGNCFEAYYKNYKRLSSIRKLIPKKDSTGKFLSD